MQLQPRDLARAFLWGIGRDGRRSRWEELRSVSWRALLRVGRSTVLYFLYPGCSFGSTESRSLPSFVKSWWYTREGSFGSCVGACCDLNHVSERVCTIYICCTICDSTKMLILEKWVISSWMFILYISVKKNCRIFKEMQKMRKKEKKWEGRDPLSKGSF